MERWRSPAGLSPAGGVSGHVHRETLCQHTSAIVFPDHPNKMLETRFPNLVSGGKHLIFWMINPHTFPPTSIFFCWFSVFFVLCFKQQRPTVRRSCYRRNGNEIGIIFRPLFSIKKHILDGFICAANSEVPP